MNLISDLGATMCGIADEGSRVERYVCSPGHVWANAATALNGLLLVAGAVALWAVFPRKVARAGLVLLMLGGALVVGVGLTPWNLQPDLHNLFALVQAPVQWVGMILLAVGMPRLIVGRGLPVITVVAVALSVVGFALFVLAVGGDPWAVAIGAGFTERLAFDTLTLWGGLVGIVLLARAPRETAIRTPSAPPHVPRHTGM